jgi:hypothetical protein
MAIAAVLKTAAGKPASGFESRALRFECRFVEHLPDATNRRPDSPSGGWPFVCSAIRSMAKCRFERHGADHEVDLRNSRQSPCAGLSASIPVTSLVASVMCAYQDIARSIHNS